MGEYNSSENGARRLAGQIASGDARAFELLYRMEFLNLVHFIDSYIHDTHRAEDLAQESLCALWEMHSRIDPRRNIRALLFSIARNRTLNSLKEKALFANPALAESINADIMAIEDESMQELIESLDLQKLINDVWGKLPEAARESFRLSRDEELSYAEISGIRGLSRKAVEYHISLSLKMFRRRLKNYLDGKV